MIRSPAPDLPAVHPGPGRRTQARRARNGLAAAVAIAGSLVISTTALALLEHVSDRATEVFGDVDQGLDGYGELFIGDPHRSTDLFAAIDGASSSSTESYRLATSESCSQPSEIHATAPTKGDLLQPCQRGEDFVSGHMMSLHITHWPEMTIGPRSTWLTTTFLPQCEAILPTAGLSPQARTKMHTILAIFLRAGRGG